MAGIPFESMFAHKWFIGTNSSVSNNEIKLVLDEQLKLLNDDYKTERICALKDIIVEISPCETFNAWMKSKGKQGGQHKFPRVLKTKQLEEWENFLKLNV